MVTGISAVDANTTTVSPAAGFVCEGEEREMLERRIFASFILYLCLCVCLHVCLSVCLSACLSVGL